MLGPHAPPGNDCFSVLDYTNAIAPPTTTLTDSRRITLEEMLDPAVMAEYQKQQSNNKALVVPHKITLAAHNARRVRAKL